MKKFLLTLTAFAALVACSKDEIVDSQPAQAIAFSDIFVENTTRTPYDGSYKYDGTTGNLTKFHVYGTVTNADGDTANIFNKQLVEKNGSAWTYSPVQYWIPGNKYNFTAIADGNEDTTSGTQTATRVNLGANDMPVSITVHDAAQQKDVLIAISEPNIEGKYSANEKVAFTFDHIMSKAKFTVYNNITTEGYTYKVTDVKITNAPTTATYTIGTGWGAPTAGTYELSFGDIVSNGTETGAAAEQIAYNGGHMESNYERLLIPTATTADNTAVAVSFNYELLYDNVSVFSDVKTATANVKLEPGHAYNFKVVLSAPGEPIQFTVTKINDWDYDINEDGSVDTKDDVTMQ